MRRSRQKWKTERGTSAALALIIFTVAALLSTAVVTAAVTALQGSARKTEEERSFLSVTSAAALLRETLQNDSVRITETEANGVVTTMYAYLPEEEEDTALSGLVKTLVREAWENEGAQTPYGRLALTVSGHEDMDVDIWLTLYPAEQRLEALLAPADPSVSSPDGAAYGDASVRLVFTNVTPRQAGEPARTENEDGSVTVVTRYEMTFLPENSYAQGGADR